MNLEKAEWFLYGYLSCYFIMCIIYFSLEMLK